LSEKAIASIIAKKKKSKESGKGFGAQFLRMNEPSFTIPARYWKDGYYALVKYDDTHIRRLTILELKRILTFPDNYYLHGNKKDQIMQIRNAVPSKLSYYIGKYLRQLIFSVKFCECGMYVYKYKMSKHLLSTIHENKIKELLELTK
jgi:site-specific DNA-cytosine methylase